jgi:hypothetical protein
MTPKQREIELAYFNSLIRSLLTREAALYLMSNRPFGKDSCEARYLLSLQNKQNLLDWQVEDTTFDKIIIYAFLEIVLD